MLEQNIMFKLYTTVRFITPYRYAVYNCTAKWITAGNFGTGLCYVYGTAYST